MASSTAPETAWRVAGTVGRLAGPAGRKMLDVAVQIEGLTHWRDVIMYNMSICSKFRACCWWWWYQKISLSVKTLGEAPRVNFTSPSPHLTRCQDMFNGLRICFMLDRVQTILIGTWLTFTKADRPAFLAWDIPRWRSTWTSRELGPEDCFPQEITHALDLFSVMVSCGMCTIWYFVCLVCFPNQWRFWCTKEHQDVESISGHKFWGRPFNWWNSVADLWLCIGLLGQPARNGWERARV